MAPDTVVLRVERLDKWFGGLRALDGMTFELERGMITALVGPNGAGKTTAFNVVTGYLTADGGEVFLDGRRITGLPAHRIAGLRLGRTFQDVRIFSRMTLLDNVAVAYGRQTGEDLLAALGRPLRVRREERERRAEARRWLEFIRLADKADEFAGNLSYGQQKLLSIARVLALGAEVLLLDEPLSGLDPHILKSCADLLRRLRSEAGKTICLIEHNIDIVRELADRVVFLDQGRVLAAGPPEMIFGNAELTELYFGR